MGGASVYCIFFVRSGQGRIPVTNPHEQAAGAFHTLHLANRASGRGGFEKQVKGFRVRRDWRTSLILTVTGNFSFFLKVGVLRVPLLGFWALWTAATLVLVQYQVCKAKWLLNRSNADSSPCLRMICHVHNGGLSSNLCHVLAGRGNTRLRSIGAVSSSCAMRACAKRGSES